MAGLGVGGYMMTGKFNILFFLFLPLLRMAKIVAEGSFKYLTDKLVIIYRVSQKKVYHDTGLDSKPITSLLY